jgi:hypothetical protein
LQLSSFVEGNLNKVPKVQAAAKPQTKARTGRVASSEEHLWLRFSLRYRIPVMQYEAMGVVSALRETSVVWAAIIGRIFLKEKLTVRRIGSCLAIAAGAACLAY